MRSHFSFYINDYIIYVVLRRGIDEEFVSVHPIPGIFACYICIIAFIKPITSMYFVCVLMNVSTMTAPAVKAGIN